MRRTEQRKPNKSVESPVVGAGDQAPPGSGSWTVFSAETIKDLSGLVKKDKSLVEKTKPNEGSCKILD